VNTASSRGFRVTDRALTVIGSYPVRPFLDLDWVGALAVNGSDVPVADETLLARGVARRSSRCGSCRLAAGAVRRPRDARACYGLVSYWFSTMIPLPPRTDDA